ncbi:hypothetical protein MCEGEM3_02486 [Oxalobacteraceae bacterium]
MTTLNQNGFTYIDGLGGINIVDGVVRIDLVAISGFEAENKAVAQRAGGLAVSLTGFVKMHEQMSKVIEDLVQKGVLQKRDNAQQAAPLALETVPAPTVEKEARNGKKD